MILAIVWLIGFILPFAILALQTLFGYYEGKESEAWSWFTPIILPTIGLVVGTLVADAMNPHPEEQLKRVNLTIFIVTLILSLVYLSVTISVILIGQYQHVEPSQMFKRSGPVLGAIQSLVTATMGFFFVNKNTKDS